MAGGDQLQLECGGNSGTNVAAGRRNLGERGPDVEPGQDPGGLLYPGNGGSHPADQDVEQLRLPRRYPLLGAQHFGLVLLELRSDVALRGSQGLTPLEGGRNLRRVGVGDFDVVPEDFVVSDLERRDPAALPFTLLDGSDVRLAADSAG